MNWRMMDRRRALALGVGFLPGMAALVASAADAGPSASAAPSDWIDTRQTLEPAMIEVALNELSPQKLNPHVPNSIDQCVRDAIACAKAGANIVHFHARSRDGSQSWFDASFYTEAYRRIKSECDVILYPTQPGVGVDAFKHVWEIADTPGLKLELETIDIMPVRQRPLIQQGVPKLVPYDFGPGDPMAETIKELRRRNVAFHIGIREVGDMRYLKKYRDEGLLGDDVTVKLFFDQSLAGPFPDARGILMYLDSVPPGMRCRWFVTLYAAFGARGDDGTLRRLCTLAAAMGGHLRVGLGDLPLMDGKAYSNADHVKIAGDICRAAGRKLATMAEARRMLGISSRS